MEGEKCVETERRGALNIRSRLGRGGSSLNVRLFLRLLLKKDVFLLHLCGNSNFPSTGKT